MSYSVKLLQENLDLFELVLVDIERAWSELGNENSIRTDFESKFKLLDANKPLLNIVRLLNAILNPTQVLI